MQEKRVLAAVGKRTASLKTAALVAAGVGVALAATPAQAQMSANDGYAPDGSYRFQTELSPYVWLPATSASISLGPRGNITANSSSGVPSASQLAGSLHGAFFGYGLTRYGPFSFELNFQWATASAGSTSYGPRGNAIHASTSVTFYDVAPGIGYEVARGAVGDMPATLDVRTGFAWDSYNAKIGTLDFPQGVTDSSSFVQPWLGLRGRLYPAPKWRIEADALTQGFGVGGGGWGYGGSLLVSYEVTHWFVITGGFHGSRTQRFDDEAGPLGNGHRSLDLSTYGPLLGVGFRF